MFQNRAGFLRQKLPRHQCQMVPGAGYSGSSRPWDVSSTFHQTLSWTWPTRSNQLVLIPSLFLTPQEWPHGSTHGKTKGRQTTRFWELGHLSGQVSILPFSQAKQKQTKTLAYSQSSLQFIPGWRNGILKRKKKFFFRASCLVFCFYPKPTC